MKKEDFKKGQTVYVLLVGNRFRRGMKSEDRIQEWEVVSVGSKYITAGPKGYADRKYCQEKFEIENNFKQVYKYGCEDYILYLSKEEILENLKRGELLESIHKVCRWDGNLRKLSTEKLEQIWDIMKEVEKKE